MGLVSHNLLLDDQMLNDQLPPKTRSQACQQNSTITTSKEKAPFGTVGKVLGKTIQCLSNICLA